MSLNSQIAMINIAICKQDGWSNPCENWVKQVYFFLLYTIFFSNVIYSENITDIDKFHNFKHSKNLKRLPSLVSFLLCVFMKRSQNFYSFSNSKMFTIFFPPEKKKTTWSAVHLWTVHFGDPQFTTWHCFYSRWLMLWYVPNKCSVNCEHYESYIWLERNSL